MRRGRVGALSWLLAAALLVAGCGSEPQTPEAQIRAMIAAGESAVREHDLPALKAMIAAGYQDGAGRDKAGLESVLTVHFLRNSRIHLLVRIREIAVASPDRAAVEALIATAGHPIPSLEALAEVNADLLWVDLDLARRDDAWRVTSAIWERARLEDLL